MSTVKKISVSEFKAKSLGLFEQISKSGKELIIYKRGKPIAKVIPFPNKEAKSTLGQLSQTVLFEGDLITPFGSDLWKAAQ